jgi:hypothetical protein
MSHQDLIDWQYRYLYDCNYDACDWRVITATFGAKP